MILPGAGLVWLANAQRGPPTVPLATWAGSSMAHTRHTTG